jgi:deoxyinosine 3'endonuclease (endonuclease V)
MSICCCSVGISESSETEATASHNAEDEHKEIVMKWTKEQDDLKKQCRLADIYHWQTNHCVINDNGQHSCKNNDMTDAAASCIDRLTLGPSDIDTACPLTYVAGVDISFVKNDKVNACAALVVVKLPHLEIVYKDLSMVCLTAPYIAGFLAFREADFLVSKVRHLQKHKPDLMPQALLVDGNGTLHCREFGVACHIGVLLDLPTVGVAKTLFHVDGLENDAQHHEKINSLLLKGGDTFPLIGQSGRCLGMALRASDKAPNPIYVSPGHLVTMETAVWLVKQCCRYRVPEPVRQADIQSREYLRDHWPPSVSQTS